MSNSETVRVSVDDLNWGFEAEHCNIHEKWIMGDESLNIGMGRQIGMGPRHGMAPIPGQQADPSGGAAQTGGGGYTLRESEYVAAAGDPKRPNARTRIWGIQRIRYKNRNNASLASGEFFDAYFYLVDGNKYLTNSYYSIANSFETVYSGSGSISRGMDQRIVSAMPDTQFNIGSFPISFRVRSPLHEFRRIGSLKNYIPMSVLNVTGKDFRCSLFVSESLTNLYDSISTLETRIPVSAKYQWQDISIGFNASKSTFRLNTHKIFDAASIDGSTNKMSFDGWEGAINTPNCGLVGGGSYSFQNPDFANAATEICHLYRSEALTQNSSHTAIMVAAERPIVGIVSFQTSFGQPFSYSPIQYADPTDNPIYQIDVPTITAASTGTRYSEDGSVKSTCWDRFPAFVTGTPLAKDSVAPLDGNNHFTLTEPGTGILKKGTVYEIAFSMFDKSIALESNVGTPAKFQTGTDDAVSITVYRQPTSPTYYTAFAQTGAYDTFTTGGGPEEMWHPYFPGVYSGHAPKIMNYPRCNLEIRFYYREFGTFEWLPAGSIDYYDLFMDPLLKKFSVCQGAIAALPGPQPGAFSDNSPLPLDNYFDVVSYQNYVFWMSEKNLVYSSRNNALSYPILNALPAQRGSYRGMIEHAYPGQSTQDSRLMVCTTDSVYIGRFRGDGYFVNVPLRVSADTVASFPRPGSDFVLDFWTSQVPFSSRSMVVAEGILYWWGPQGIYRDNGTTLPEKSWSMHMEPYINENYDQKEILNIHGTYDSSTKEVIWFYIPKDKSTYSCKALVYSTKHDAFYEYQFKNMLIDWSQYLDVVTTGSVNQDLSGRRTLVGVRTLEAGYTTTPQRAVFFDTLCNSGDYNAPFQYLATTITAQGGGVWRFTLNSPGKTPPASGRVTISGFKWYAQSALDLDGIWTIAGSAATYIDLIPPTGITAGAFSAASHKTYFPLFVEAENGFDCKLQSEYHEPYGPSFWGRWTYIWHRYRVELYKATLPQTLTLEFKSLTDQGPAASRTCTLTDNCRTNCAIYSQIPFDNEAAEGNAVATAIYPTGGRWNGGRWYLQSCAFDILPMSKENLRYWEG